MLNQKEKQKQFILNGNLWKVMFNLSWSAVIAMVLYGSGMQREQHNFIVKIAKRILVRYPFHYCAVEFYC